MLPADMNKAFFFFFPSYKMHTLGIFGRLVFFFFSEAIKYVRVAGTEVEWKKYVDFSL